MWKYQCKGQFLTLLGSFLFGCAIAAIFFYSGIDNSEAEVISEFLPQFSQIPNWMMIISGGLGIAGFVNMILIMQILTNKFNINYFLVLIVMMFAFNVAYTISIYLVIPMMIVTLYGWISLVIKTKRQTAVTGDDEELIRIYQIHHPMDEKVKTMAEQCRKVQIRVSMIYALGLVAFACVLFFFNNLILMMIALLFFLFAFNLLNRYKANCIVPITQLLYVNCNPVACASAIIYYSSVGRKKKLHLKSLFAQCLIYLDDPELAQDVLITYPRKDPNSSLTYWSLMSYVDYLLKDEDALIRCKEEASKIKMRYGPAGVMMKSEEIKAIENRINLMNSDFNACRKYYLNIYNHTNLPFEQMDAAYYIGLISFVQQDYPVAVVYFEKVAAKANTMYFKKKAENYLEKLEGMNLDSDGEEILQIETN